MPDTSQDLRDRCVAARDAGVSWQVLWCLIAEHGRYEKLLIRCAYNAVRRSRLPSDWEGDIVSAARLRLAQRLQDNHFLKVDPEQVEEHFLPRLVAVTRNLCRQAVRSTEDKFLGRASAIDAGDLPDDTTPEGFSIDFENALSKLTDRQRLAVVMRFSDRCKIREIAKEMGLTRRQVEYAIEQALARLRRIMSPPRDSDE